MESCTWSQFFWLPSVMPESQHISHSIYCSPYISNQGCFLPQLMFYHPQLFASSGWCAVCVRPRALAVFVRCWWLVCGGVHRSSLATISCHQHYCRHTPLTVLCLRSTKIKDSHKIYLTIDEGFIAYKYSFCLSADYKTSFVSYDRVWSKICRVYIFYHGVLSSQICKMSLCNIQFKTSNDSFFFEHIFWQVFISFSYFRIILWNHLNSCSNFHRGVEKLCMKLACFCLKRLKFNGICKF